MSAPTPALPRAEVEIVPTPLGPARLHLYGGGAAQAHPAGRRDLADSGEEFPRPAGTLVLGHGAGGGVGAPDLVAVTAAVVAAGWEVVLVEQPWRVAGRRVAPAPATLDVGWRAVMATMTSPSRPLVVGGRSAGARVACRTAVDVGADAVCCLAFPLHPPGRPERSRAAELLGAGVPVLVVQGGRDAFGSPAEVLAATGGQVEVVAVPGDHALRAAPGEVSAAVLARLAQWARTE